LFKNREGKVRSGWKIAGMMGAVYAIIVLIEVIIGFVFGVLFLMNNPADGSNNLQSLNFTDAQMDFLNTISMFIQEIVMILVPILTWKFIIKRSLTNMGLAPITKHTKELLVGLLFGMVSMTIVFFVLVLSGSAEVKSWKPHFSMEQLIYLVLYIMVGFAEEIFGRGYIMSALRQTRNLTIVIIISSVLFALLHSLNSGIGLIPYLNLTLVGVLFAFMYLRSGNIWMCIGYHITWNYFQGYVFGFNVSGNQTDGILTTVFDDNKLLNGGAFGPEGGLIVTAVILIGFLFVWYYYRNHQFDFIATEPVIQRPQQDMGNNFPM
jgi:uncharacterized protein